jgi:beta-glucanase (GH16 family)
VTRTIGAALLACLLWSPQIVIRNANDCDNTPSPCAAFNGSDEFNAASLDSTNWTNVSREGDTSNSELQCYKPANNVLSGGNLVQTLKLESVTCNAHSYSYTGGLVMWKTYNFTYGTVTWSGRVAGGLGPFLSVWLLGANCQDSFPTSADDSGDCTWPQVGAEEIDIGDFHFNDRLNVDQRIYSGAANPGCSPGLSDAATNTHVYQFIWSAGSAVWKIDGSTTCTVNTNVPSTPMFLIIDAAMHGTVTATLPQTNTIDYVRVTQP